MENPIIEFEVLEPVERDGVRYEPDRDGNTCLIAMTAQEARQLVEIGAIRAIREADDPPLSPSPGGGEAAREAAIAAAISALNRADASFFTAAGKPTLAALRDAGAPADVTATERDAAWSAAG